MGHTPTTSLLANFHCLSLVDAVMMALRCGLYSMVFTLFSGQYTVVSTMVCGSVNKACTSRHQKGAHRQSAESRDLNKGGR